MWPQIVDKIRWLSVIVVAISCTQAVAAPEFPADPQAWLNFMPLSAESLEGKGAVLWFFEEGCPRCREKWPGLLEASAEFQGKPVVFIGINSGNSRREVQSYLRQVGCHWPVIVDSDGSFQKQFNIEVSLNNIYQLRIMKPDGTIVAGNPDDLKGAAEAALQGASWKVDPAEIPNELKAAWIDVELGNFPRASVLIDRSLKSSKDDVKQAAETLQGAVKSEMDSQVADVNLLLDQGHKWQAVKAINTLETQFKGFELPEELRTKKDALESDADVQSQVKAYKEFERAKEVGSKGSSAAIRRAVGMLEKLVKEYPGTEAAVEAQKILANVNAGG